MLHIVKDQETIEYNLLNPETGQLLFKEWVNFIEKKYMRNCVPGVDPTTFSTFFVISKYIKSALSHKYIQDLLDENGNTIASGRGVEIWFEGSAENPPILCVRLESRDKDGKEVFKEILTDFGGTALTDRGYDKIESYNGIPYWRKYIKVQDEGKMNFIRRSDYTLLSPTWFDKNIHNHAYDNDPNYVATVKYRGRWHHLHADGTMSGPIKQYA